MKLHYLLLLSFLSVAVFAAPLTHYDKELLKRLDVNAIEPLTQEPFKDLIAEAQAKQTRFALSAVRDTFSNKLHFFDTPLLFSTIETTKKFENPVNRQPIKSIRLYLVTEEVPFHELYRKAFTHYRPSHGALHLRHKPYLTEEFVGELKDVPQEGFYQYMKRRGIDSTNFTGPFKQYNPQNLPVDPHELRRIITEYYPVDQQTFIAAHYVLSGLLYNAAQINPLLQNINLPEAENLALKVISNKNTPAKIRDKAGYILTHITTQKLIKKQAQSPSDELIRDEIQRSQKEELWPLLKDLMRADSTLEPSELDYIRQIYFHSLIVTHAPVEEIKNAALSALQNSSNNVSSLYYITTILKAAYDGYQYQLRTQRLSENNRRYIEEFIAAFPNGEIVE